MCGIQEGQPGIRDGIVPTAASGIAVGSLKSLTDTIQIFVILTASIVLSSLCLSGSEGKKTHPSTLCLCWFVSLSSFSCWNTLSTHLNYSRLPICFPLIAVSFTCAPELLCEPDKCHVVMAGAWFYFTGQTKTPM